MRKMFVIAAAALMLAALGGWAASSTHARVTPARGIQIDPAQLMINSKSLPIGHYDDYSLVF
jgi:hypothetical protein